MSNDTTTINPESFIVATLGELLQRRGAGEIEVRPESNLLTDLTLDSLDLAELSAALEDGIGRDPFSQGLFPETVAELVDFYKQP